MGFYFYGEGNIQDELKFLDKEYLSSYENKVEEYQAIKVNAPAQTTKYKDIVTHTSECNSSSISFLLG